MFFSNDKTNFIAYLNEILSIENAVIERLHRRMQETSLQNSRNSLKDQLQEEKEQQRRLENLIADHGGKPTDSKADLLSLSSLTDAMKKKKDSQDEVHDNKNDIMTPQEIEILNTKEDALIKNADADHKMHLSVSAESRPVDHLDCKLDESGDLALIVYPDIMFLDFKS